MNNDIIKIQQEITINNTKPVESIKDIKNAKRLFYQLGHHPSTSYFNPTTGQFIRVVRWNKWNRSQIFKEITDIEDMLRRDKNLNDPDYIKHHNFRYI